MSYDPNDTICAIATAPGGAARGIVRMSGPDAVNIVDQLFHADDGRRLDRLRQAAALAGHVPLQLDDSSPRRLPCDVLLWPTARSYSRQPVAELHTIGSPSILEAVMSAVCRAGARLAEPGEFTLRAFLAGRIDLTQAEAVLGVIDARAAEELDSALAQLAGGLARPLQNLREELLQLLAELEAGLDFVDEDIEFVSSAELLERLESAGRLLADVSEQMASRHTAGGAQQVALFGPPNAGKSSLFNALVARYGIRSENGGGPSTSALVSPQRGTTRDYLTATIDLGGIRCELVDTAGVDEHRPGGDCTIEAASQALAVERREQAAIRAACIDATDRSTPGTLRVLQCDMIVLTKTDLVHPAVNRPVDRSCDVLTVATSSRTGEGLDALCEELRRLLRLGQAAQRGQVVAATADRCRESIRLAAASVRQATEIVIARGGDELVAAEIRGALTEIGKVVGAVYTDDLLDRIFSTFCIGK